MNKKLLLAFILVFSFMPLVAQEQEVTTINILNARQTSYQKAEDTGNDVIILEGAVELDVQKGETTSNIKADRITYDRKTEMLYAEGNVEIETKGSNSGGEKTMAESVLLNTSTLEGIFDGGKVVQTQSDALNLPSGSTLIVFSDLFGKGSENTISFKNSSLTFCDDENPHWHIDATRTWLLPGGEFAFFNALLYVGVIPVLYLPAFYYPKDELVFNPVFSYSKRAGYSVQTTTYLYGRKPLNTASSTTSSDSETSSVTSDALKGLYNFVRPSTLKEQKLEGIVLHNLDEDYTGDTSQYVKIFADWYSNLGLLSHDMHLAGGGYMFGFDTNFQPSNQYISRIALGADVGLSDTVFKLDGNYYPFSSTGTVYHDSSTFLGLTMPFRYSGNFEFSLSKPFRFTLTLPIYSDPYYAYDFKQNRQETMDWISYLLENMGSNNKNEESSISEISSFSWQLSVSGNPTIPDFMRPFITSLSLSLNSSVNISSMTTTDFSYNGGDEFEPEWKSYTPSRRFYYPSTVTPASATLSASGTLFSWPPQTRAATKKRNYTFPIAVNKPDGIKTDKQLAEEAALKAEKEQNKEEKGDTAENKDEVENEDSQEEDPVKFTLPELAYTPSSTSISEGINYSLSYSVNANVVTQMAYASENLKKSEDFEWEKVKSSMYTVKTPATLTSTFNYGGNFLSVSNGISYSPVWQQHPYISDDEKIGYSESAKNTLILSDYNAESQDVSNTNTVSIRPFSYINTFSDTSFSYNSNIKLYRRKFIGDIENPEWEVLSVDFDDENCVTANSFSEVFSAKEFNNKIAQSLTLTQVLPPLAKQFTASLALTFPYVTATIGTGVQEVKESSTEGAEIPNEWKKNPLQQGINVTIPLFNNNLTVSESYTYNLEEELNDSLKFAAAWNGFSLAYLLSYTYGYDFDNGWKIRQEQEFLPYSFTFSYSLPTKTYYKWFNRIQVAPGLSTSVVADLIRPTNSYLLFSPSITFKLNQFMNLTFSSSSRNSVLYWYFHNDAGELYSDWGGFPGNMLKDLIDSFRFDDTKKREGSGYKLKSLNMTLTHELHDWNFNLSLKIEPRMIVENNKKRYDFSPYMTIGIVWNPMESIKTSIIDEYGEWKLE